VYAVRNDGELGSGAFGSGVSSSAFVNIYSDDANTISSPKGARSNDICWNETLSIAAIRADSFVTNRRMFHSEKLNKMVYPDSESADDINPHESAAAAATADAEKSNPAGKHDSSDAENGYYHRSRHTHKGTRVLLAYAPSWRARPSSIAPSMGMSPSVITSPAPQANDTTDSSPALLTSAPTDAAPVSSVSAKESSGRKEVVTASNYTAAATTGAQKLTSKVSEVAILTDFDAKFQLQQESGGGGGGGGIVSTITNSLKRRDVETHDVYNATNQILTVNSSKLGISVPPISPAARSGATGGHLSSNRHTGVTSGSGIFSAAAPENKSTTASSAVGTAEDFGSNILDEKSLIVKPASGKIFTLQHYTDKNANNHDNNKNDNKLLKDVTLPAVLQRLNRTSKATKLASGIAVEINALAKRYVNQYGSYYRYASYDRISSRLSFLMNDSCLDTYTQCFMYNTHMPIMDNNYSASPAANTGTGTNADTGSNSHAVATQNNTAPASAFSHCLSQPHLHPNWFIGACFDEISFIAVNPSPYDMHAGRARWSGLSLLSTGAIAAPFLCAARQLKYFLLLRQQYVESDGDRQRSRLLSDSSISINDYNQSTTKAGRAVKEKLNNLDSNRDVTVNTAGTRHTTSTGTSASMKRTSQSTGHRATHGSEGAFVDKNDDSNANEEDDHEDEDGNDHVVDDEEEDDEDASDDDDDDDEDENEIIDVNASKPFFVEGDQMYVAGGVSKFPSHFCSDSAGPSDSLKAIHVQSTTTTITTTTTTTTTTLVNSNGSAYSNKTSNSKIVQSSTINTDALTWENRRYDGFIHLSGDMYCKDGETNVLLNEIAVRSLLRCAQNKSRRR